MESPTDLLLFTAHCDDGELWAGGTISKLVECGKRVVLAIAHHDTVRRGEALAGAAVLGCEVWFKEEQVGLVEWASTCLNDARPVVLMTHAVSDPHFEHESISQSVRQVLTKSKHRRAYPQRWYSLDTYYSTESVGFPILIDISSHFQQKLSALDCHNSQSPGDLAEMARTMNALHGQRIRVQYAEAFYPFPLLGRLPRLRELP
jgi:LmbE family N-acetylglucosaminyl deacetylase